MHSGWIRAFVLVVAAALLGSAQCYGNCSRNPSAPAHPPSNSCHHHPKSPHDDAGCPYRHSSFAGPEAGIAKITLAAGASDLHACAAVSTAVFTRSEPLIHVATGSPPGLPGASDISILRI